MTPTLEQIRSMLPRFCASPRDIREWMHAPARTTRGTVATNSHIIILLNGHDPCDVDMQEFPTKKIFTALDAPCDAPWIEIAPGTAADLMHACTMCEGSGLWVKCQHCRGEGNTGHGLTLEDCTVCNGAGGFPGHASDPHATVCPDCDGFRDDIKLQTGIEIGNAYHSRRYIRLLAEIGAELQPNGDELPSKFRFAHGTGLLMPRRRTVFGEPR